MSELTNKAIAKITDEMMKLEDPIAQGVEEHLTEICTTDAIAEKLLAPEKSLKGATDMLWAEAKKRKKGNSAYIPPAEAYAMVDEYYGINEAAQTEVIDIMSLL